MRPDVFLQLGAHTPRLAENRRVVDRDAAVLQRELEIAVADREHQTPAHRPEDHLGSELPALERLTLHHRRLSTHHVAADHAACWPAPKLCNKAIRAMELERA
jgi:TorA maturation chaperone TorD